MKGGWLALTAVWLALVGGGFAYMLGYESTPGADEAAPPKWPAPGTVALSAERPTLIMFAHPQCPCTRASMEELARLMARCQGKVDAHVLFIQPKGEKEDWVKSGLWRAAEEIPGVKPQIDEEGRTARGFGADTSGRVVVYDPAGKLIFSGGITESRGHEGDNDGREAIVALLSNQPSARSTTPVYGCKLTSPNQVTPPATCQR